MRPLPRPAPQPKSERPSAALGNVFAIPTAPLLPQDTDSLAAGPPLQKDDDATVEVGETESGAILLDLSDPDGAALKAAAQESIPAPVLRDSSGKPYENSFTGIQEGMFAGVTDDASTAANSGGSSASTPMQEVERMDIIHAMGKLGLTFRPGIKISSDDMRAYRTLLVDRKWVWIDDLPKLRRKLILLFRSVFPDEIERTLPTFATENAQRLAVELLKLLKGRDLAALAKELKRTMPDLSPPKEPPPLPPDSKK